MVLGCLAERCVTGRIVELAGFKKAPLIAIRFFSGVAVSVITLLTIPLHHVLHGMKAEVRQQNAPTMASR